MASAWLLELISLRNGSIITLIITFSILLSGTAFLTPDETEVKGSPTRRVDHSPISINGNSQLLSRASSEGWPGTGAEGNPVTISGYRIGARNGIGIGLYNIDLHVRIIDMNITSSDPASILLSSCSNIEVSDSDIYYIRNEGIKLDSSNNCSINNNTFDKEDIISIGYNGIYLTDSSDNSIVDNRIARIGNDGISILGTSTRNVIERNDLVECTNNAILVRSDYNRIISNEGTASGWGIRIRGSHNYIGDNWVRRNSYGIYVSEGEDNLIEDNICNRNFIGINIVLTVENIVKNNYVGKSASYGIDLYTNVQSRNQVYGNHFYYNNKTEGYYQEDRIQARDLKTGNLWYDESTNRGNFWFDWRGNDNNDDQIVDLSYPIEGDGSRDLYPLLNPSMPDAFSPPWRVRANPQPNYIEIIWEEPFYGMGVDVRSYHIYRSERGGGEFYIDKVDGDTKSYRDYDVRSGIAYFYYIIALNDIGFSNQSMRIKSSPDTQRPTLSITTPEDGDIFATTSVRILYEGNDNIAIDRYEVVLDGGEPIDKGPWENITFLGLSEGEHTVNVTVYDLAEHYRTKTVTFFVDITLPTITIDKPEDGVIITSIRTPTITWSANDVGSGIAGYALSLDGAPFANIGGRETYTFGELLPGPHMVSVLVRDRAGNERNDTVNLTVDPIGPSLNIIEPINYYVNNTGSIFLRWYGADTGTGVDKYLIRWGQEDWYDLGNFTSYRIDSLSEGSHTIYLRIYDLAGNNLTKQRIVTVDLTSPQMDILTPVHMERYSEPFNVVYSANDLLTGVGNVRFKMDDGEYRTYGPDDVITIGPVENGMHDIILELSDNAGNTVTRTASFIYDIRQPIVVDFFPRDEDVPVDSDIKLQFSELMDMESIVIDIVGVTGNISMEDRNLTLTLGSDLEYGTTYSIRVTGKDLAGNDLVPFDWTFETVENVAANQGRVSGRVLDTSGHPLANATVRFKTGESVMTDMNGSFEIILSKGSNHVIVSIPGYQETMVEFDLDGGQDLDLGELPVKVIVPVEDDDEGESNTWLIIVIVAIILVIIFAALIGYQIKRTRDYANQPPIPDEWVNGRAVPLKEQMEQQMGPAGDGMQR